MIVGTLRNQKHVPHACGCNGTTLFRTVYKDLPGLSSQSIGGALRHAACSRTGIHMADPITKINSSVGGPESATAQSSNAGEKGTSAGKSLAGDTGGMHFVFA